MPTPLQVLPPDDVGNRGAPAGGSALDLTEQRVALHYHRHCRRAPLLDRLMIRYSAAFPDLAPTGGVGLDDQLRALAWARDQGPDRAADADLLLRDLGDLDALERHCVERAAILAQLDQAAEAYAATHGVDGVRYVTGGVTPDTVHLYSPDGDQSLSMPIGWALAYQAAQV